MIPLRLPDYFAGTVRAAEYAEARVEAIDRLVRRGHALGVWVPTVLLGPVVAAGPYVNAPEGGYVLQSALAVPAGFGGMVWDEDEYLGLAESARPVAAEGRITPFARLSALDRARLAGELDGL
jgi:hypothetical protein